MKSKHQENQLSKEKELCSDSGPDEGRVEKHKFAWKITSVQVGFMVSINKG